jgi:hypothetical protein
MPPEVDTFFTMFAVFATAQGIVREGAWAACLKYLVENPRVYQFAAARLLTQEMIAQVEVALLKAFAAAGVERGILATARPSLSMLMARLGMSFSPKIPLPQAQAALTIALCCGALAQFVSSTYKMKQKVPEYENYLVSYVSFSMSAVSYHPWVSTHLAPPALFDEWYESAA